MLANCILMHFLADVINSGLVIVFDTVVIAVTLSTTMETTRQMRGLQANSLSQVLVKQGRQCHSFT